MPAKMNAIILILVKKIRFKAEKHEYNLNSIFSDHN